MASLSGRLSASSRHQRDYSPVSWTEYFDEAHDICIRKHTESDRDDSKPQTNNESPSKPVNGANQREDGHLATQSADGQSDSFRVYLRNFREPYAPKREFGEKFTNHSNIELSEAEMSKFSQVPTLVALHGGGYSGLTWAQFVRHIEQHCHCRVMAIDLRGHGDTKTNDDDQMDIKTLVDDVIEVVHETHSICGFLETPRVLLIGHSMGGAIAVKCSTNCPETLPSLCGFVIIDVVEGTAKDALPLMMSVIKTRPTKFPSLGNAIEWSVRSGMAKNSDAARVSMPGNLINITTSSLAIHDIPQATVNEDNLNKNCAIKNLKQHKFHIGLDSLMSPASSSATSSFSLPPRLPLSPRVAALKSGTCLPAPSCSPVQQVSLASIGLASAISEEESEEPASISSTCDKDGDGYKRPPEVDSTGYCWRTNLAKTQPFWIEWFDGLSDQLLASPVQAKFLLLAGIDRLDKTLTIGHMQGKFMMKVLPKCGHAVHEDVPEQVALAISDFLVRNKLTTSTDEEAGLRETISQ